MSLKIGGDIFQYTLNISLANFADSLCVSQQFYLALNSFSKISICPRIIDLSTAHVDNWFIIYNGTTKHPNKAAITKSLVKKWIHYFPQTTITSSKSTIETLEQGVKCVQS